MNAVEILREENKKLVELVINNMKKGYVFKPGWDASVLRPQNPVSDTIYKGRNMFTLMMVALEKEYDDPRWLTFNQAKEKGWHIKKGEKGTRCVKVISTEKVKEKDEKTGEIIEVERELAQKKYNFFTLFNANQMEGIPPLEKTKPDKSQISEMINNVIASSECPIKFVAQTSAFYSPLKDEIVLPLRGAFKSEESFLATALHEMGHSTGHKSRLNRTFGKEFGSKDYAQEELVAELCSVLTQARLNAKIEGEHLNNHSAYLESWIKALEEDPTILFKVAREADKASKRIYDNYLEREKQVIKQLDKEITNTDKPKEYWRIEYNELDGNVKNYKGQILTKDLLDEIKKLDETKFKNGEILKFYLEHIKDGKIIHKVQPLNIGAKGVNDTIVFNYLYKQLEQLEKEKQRKFFRGLAVNFKWSEKDLGVKENTTLKATKAYKFLEKLNNEDKEQNKIQAIYKTKLDIQYGGYKTGDIRVDLGNLEFGGKEKVSDALEHRLKLFPKHLIQFKEAYAKEKETTPQEIVKTAQTMLKEIDDVIGKFRKQEEMYLENLQKKELSLQNPQLQAWSKQLEQNKSLDRGLGRG